MLIALLASEDNTGRNPLTFHHLLYPCWFDGFSRHQEAVEETTSHLEK
jgi:hypothetical protein